MCKVGLYHEDIEACLTGIPGKRMAASIYKSLELWKNIDGKEKSQNAIRYSLLPHFQLSSESEIDCCLAYLGYGNLLPELLVGLEFKCNIPDLCRDNKFSGRYIQSGLFDYYFLVGGGGEIAIKACSKYKNIPQIGVLDFSNANILKIPEKSLVIPNRWEQYEAIVNARMQSFESYKDIPSLSGIYGLDKAIFSQRINDG